MPSSPQGESTRGTRLGRADSLCTMVRSPGLTKSTHVCPRVGAAHEDEALVDLGRALVQARLHLPQLALDYVLDILALWIPPGEEDPGRLDVSLPHMPPEPMMIVELTR